MTGHLAPEPQNPLDEGRSRGFVSLWFPWCLCVLVFAPGCGSTGMKYRLDRGERFTIHGDVQKEIVQGQETLQKLHIRFALDCEVTDVEPEKELVSISCRLSGISIDGHTRGKPFAYDSSTAPPDGPADPLSTRYHESVGERFVVRKSLYGPITEVKGGRRIEHAMGGVPVEAVLAWFGGSFPAHSVSVGEDWTERHETKFTAEFLGLPFPAPVPVEVETKYVFAGQRHDRPAIGVETTYRARQAEGRGTGLILFDPPTGKIWLSKRDATIDVGRLHIRLKAAAAHSIEILKKNL